MAKTVWLDEDTDAVPVIRMILRELNGKDRMRPITLKALKLAKKVLGLRLQPPNKDGLQNWYLPRGWQERLERAGIDPDTGYVADLRKWKAELARIDQEKHEKQMLQERRETRESIREAVKHYIRPKQSMSPSQFIANYKLQGQIVRHMTQEQWDSMDNDSGIRPHADY